MENNNRTTATAAEYRKLIFKYNCSTLALSIARRLMELSVLALTFSAYHLGNDTLILWVAYVEAALILSSARRAGLLIASEIAFLRRIPKLPDALLNTLLNRFDGKKTYRILFNQTCLATMGAHCSLSAEEKKEIAEASDIITSFKDYLT